VPSGGRRLLYALELEHVRPLHDRVATYKQAMNDSLAGWTTTSKGRNDKETGIDT
jgi:hypothetical protein